MSINNLSYRSTQTAEKNARTVDSRHSGKDVRSTSSEFDSTGISPSGSVRLTPEENATFLRIAWKAPQIRHHYELFLLLQGAVQHFISHQILISAWGGFHNACLKFDVVSALPDVRTGNVNGCVTSVEAMLRDLHKRWIDNGQRKILLNNQWVESAISSTCNCSLHKGMRGMRSILVHGAHGERDEGDSIYVALDTLSVHRGQDVERFFDLVDPVFAQIDVAFRNVTALKVATTIGAKPIGPNVFDLSAREEEIMKWVAAGKTNLQIGAVLGISAFTVKNHVQRIFRKLGATNRVEAASIYNQ